MRLCATTALLILIVLPAARADRRIDRGQRTDRLRRELPREQLQRAYPGVRFYEVDGRPTRIYGRDFGRGTAPEVTATRFISQHAAVLDTVAADLDPRGPGRYARHLQPLVYDDASQTYAFTVVGYRQQRDGVPVFRSDLRLLVRNESGYPLVLAASTLHDLGEFRPDPTLLPDAAYHAVARAAQPPLQQFGAVTPVIWAGLDHDRVAPVDAALFEAQDGFGDWLFVADARTAAILYEEQRIFDVDLTGTVHGVGSLAAEASQCVDETPLPMGGVRVEIPGGPTAFTAADGSFVLPVESDDPVTVRASLRSPWFRVFNWPANAPDTVLETSASPADPADLLFNESNVEFDRAEVNAFLAAHVIRDAVVRVNPSYPGIDIPEFTVVVNRTDGVCPFNAWYSPGVPSINFCQAAGNGANTAWSSIVYHEYGHHLVETAGSGQAWYGEGMGDALSVVLLDEHAIGVGFFGSCNPADALRDALNVFDYPCTRGWHFCGQVLSGAVWQTRLRLEPDHPDDYLDILQNLTINSILLHSGATIAPDITIDFLTIDDNDLFISNGTPHAAAICGGFGEHNLHCPPLDPIGFIYPDGRPTTVVPGAATTLGVQVIAVSGTPAPGTAQLHYRINDGPDTAVGLPESAPNQYVVELPELACGDALDYWFTAEDEAGAVLTDPPTGTFEAWGGMGFTHVVEYDFERNPGWTVEHDAVNGEWERGIPVTTGVFGSPAVDFDGSGACWLTDNRSGESDIDVGSSTLSTAPLDLSSQQDPFITYARWFSTTVGANPNQDTFAVEITGDGTTWLPVETVGPGGPQAGGGWFTHLIRVSDFVPVGSVVQLRFRPSDLGGLSHVEAALDAFAVLDLTCAVCEEPCDDGSACTVGDVCVAGVCQGSPFDCSEFDQACNEAVCVLGAADGNCDLLSPVPAGAACDDGNPCTFADACTAGTCSGTEFTCLSTGLPECQQAACDPAGAANNCDLVVGATDGSDCDDGDPCTVGEQCAAGSCAGGTAPDCAGAGGECRLASCAAGGAEGNCDDQVALPDGQSCDNGQGICATGACVPDPGDNRVFLAAPSADPPAPIDGGTPIVMEPGSTARIEVWTANLAPDALISYQIALPGLATALDATGTVTYVNRPGPGDSVFVDTTRSDWALAGTSAQVFYAEVGLPVGFAVFVTDFAAIGAVPDGAAYLAEFELQASADGCGTYRLDFLPSGAAPDGGSQLITSGGAALPAVFPPLLIEVPCAISCDTSADCGDGDGDTVVDDACLYYQCLGDACAADPRPFGDAGGAFGSCHPDGSANVHDRAHVLLCFEDAQPCDPINLDLGGPFSDCAPDGQCDLHDVNHALSAFAAISTCTCPGGPAPTPPAVPTATTVLDCVASSAQVRPGDRFEVHVRLAEVPSLQSYQVVTEVTGGERGSLELVEIRFDHGHGNVFDAVGGTDFQARNLAAGKLLAGLNLPSSTGLTRGTLATLVYRASRTARGTFLIDAGPGTAVVGDGLTPIRIERSTPALITVR